MEMNHHQKNRTGIKEGIIFLHRVETTIESSNGTKKLGQYNTNGTTSNDLS